MSLESAAAMTRNARFLHRVEAATRQVGYGKLAADGAPGRLAAAAVTAPETVAPHFIVELAADPTITDTACPDCGYAKATDDSIRYVIDVKWDAVAHVVYPDTPQV